MSTPQIFDPNDPKSYTLDCRRFDKPVNPFQQWADRIKDATYPDAASMQVMANMRRFLLALAQRMPRVLTNDPILAAALAQLAVDGPMRGVIMAILTDMDTNIDAMDKASKANGNGAAPAGATPGYRITD